MAFNGATAGPDLILAAVVGNGNTNQIRYTFDTPVAVAGAANQFGYQSASGIATTGAPPAPQDFRGTLTAAVPGVPNAIDVTFAGPFSGPGAVPPRLVSSSTRTQ